MGGSVQWRRKNAGNGGKKPEVPKTALEQVRAKFGDKYTDGIQGANSEQIAQGIIRATEMYGDGITNTPISNKPLRRYLGFVSGVTGITYVDGERSAIASEHGNYTIGGDINSAAATTIHELTHVATMFSGTKELRDVTESENAILSKYGMSREDYAVALWGKNPQYRSSIRYSVYYKNLAKYGINASDAGQLIELSKQRDNLSNSLVSRVVSLAKQNYSTPSTLRKDISTYAKKNNHETVAEAGADVGIHGDKASPASIAVINALNALMN